MSSREHQTITMHRSVHISSSWTEYFGSNTANKETRLSEHGSGMPAWKTNLQLVRLLTIQVSVRRSEMVRTVEGDHQRRCKCVYWMARERMQSTIAIRLCHSCPFTVLLGLTTPLVFELGLFVMDVNPRLVSRNYFLMIPNRDIVQSTREGRSDVHEEEMEMLQVKMNGNWSEIESNRTDDIQPRNTATVTDS